MWFRNELSSLAEVSLYSYTLSCIERLVVDSPSRRLGFDTGSKHLRFVLNKVTIGHVYFYVFGTSSVRIISSIMLHVHLHFTALIRRRKGKVWKRVQNSVWMTEKLFFLTSCGTLDSKVLAKSFFIFLILFPIISHMISGRKRHYCCSFDGAVSYLTLRMENTIPGIFLMQHSSTDISPQNNTYIYIYKV